MADGTTQAPFASLKGQVSPGEWQARVDLAALYRLVALEGWDDMIFTHLSARVPGTEHFLINPYGFFFEEMTASALVKVDAEGAVAQKTSSFVNPAGFTIHSAVHLARADAHYVIHLHTDAGVAVSAHSEGLLPLTQHALIALPGLAYHDYEGIAVNLEERERIVRDLGDKRVMLLRNHGTLALGETAAQAWLGAFFLERACRQQCLALAAGRQGVLLASQEAQVEVREQTRAMPMVAGLAWPGLLRRLNRLSPGYDA
ncbi:MAG: class II aldolase/adducin family protein [Proteobacteria bacterium]|nr:class II aldolase/adducin family protein [Pseudomonadota bacterium]